MFPHKICLFLLTCTGFAANVLAETPYKNARDNHIYAQRLLDEVKATNPDLYVIGFHGLVPGAKRPSVIASNLDRVGKSDDDDDIAAAKESKTIGGPRTDDPSKYEMEMPLQDSAGNVVGSLSLIFPYRDQNDLSVIFVRSLSIRDRLAKKIPSFSALLKAAP